MNTDKVTRLEVIDHTLCTACTPAARILCGACGGTGVRGRRVISWNDNNKIELSLQDDGRTLKVFIDEKNSNN